MYPVDLPAVNGTGLTSASKQYLASLESTRPDNESHASSQVKVPWKFTLPETPTSQLALNSLFPQIKILGRSQLSIS